MRKLTPLLGLLTLVLGTSCAQKRDLRLTENEIKKEGVLSVGAVWIKNKDGGKKYDLELHLTNLSEKPILTTLGELQCFRGRARGAFKHHFFNAGERMINFAPFERKDFKMVCDIGSKEVGDFKVVVKFVYANPSGDGYSKGEVIAKDIEWTLSEKVFD
jgi:hypothetical protein